MLREILALVPSKRIKRAGQSEGLMWVGEKMSVDCGISVPGILIFLFIFYLQFC